MNDSHANFSSRRHTHSMTPTSAHFFIYLLLIGVCGLLYRWPGFAADPAAQARGVPYLVRGDARAVAQTVQQPTLVLLTSFETLERPPGLLGFFRPAITPRSIEEQLRSAWEGRGYGLKVVHHADRFALASALLDPSSVGVFWISASPPVETLARRVEGSNIPVLDVHGHALEAVLRQAHPNLRWLGLATFHCPIARDYLDEREGRLQTEEALAFAENASMTLHRLTLAEGPAVALRRLLERSQTRLQSPTITEGYRSECSSQEGFPLTVKREAGDGPWSAQSLIFRGTTILTLPEVLDASQTGLERTVWLPARLLKPTTDWGILVESGAPPNAQDVLPVSPLQLSSPAFPGTWHLRQKEDGSPLGRTQHIYDYVGEKRLTVPAARYELFECPPVAPVRPDKRGGG